MGMATEEQTQVSFTEEISFQSPVLYLSEEFRVQQNK